MLLIALLPHRRKPTLRGVIAIFLGRHLAGRGRGGRWSLRIRVGGGKGSIGRAGRAGFAPNLLPLPTLDRRIILQPLLEQPRACLLSQPLVKKVAVGQLVDVEDVGGGFSTQFLPSRLSLLS